MPSELKAHGPKPQGQANPTMVDPWGVDEETCGSRNGYGFNVPIIAWASVGSPRERKGGHYAMNNVARWR